VGVEELGSEVIFGILVVTIFVSFYLFG